MATNLESAFHLSQLAHPFLKASGSGSIVFMSSAAGVVHINVGSIYGATKGIYLHSSNYCSKTNINLRMYMCSRVAGAMNQLARNLACEWASDSIRINSVCPWFIATPLANKVRQ